MAGCRSTISLSAMLLLGLAASGCRGRAHRAAPRDAGGDGPLPREPGRPLTAAAIDRLAALTIADAQVAVAARSDDDVALVVTRAGLRATVTASACLACPALDLSAWEALRPSLAAVWAPGSDQPSPPPGVALTLAALTTPPAIVLDARRGDGQRAAYLAHWNDGVTQLQVLCEEATGAPVDRPSPCAPLVAAVLTPAVAALAP
ncbi:MAG: hypothetical protein R3B06_27840 [Kofleriaceae bacterium]